MNKDNSKVFEILTLIVVLINMTGTAYFYIKYEAPTKEASVDLSKLEQLIKKQEYASKQLEIEYLQPIKQQQVDLNKLEINIREMLVEKEIHQKKMYRIEEIESLNPNVDIVVDINDVGSFRTNGNNHRFVTVQISLNNSSTVTVYIDATYYRVFAAELPKWFFDTDKHQIINSQKESGPIEWKNVAEKAECNEFFEENRNIYPLIKELPKKIKWDIKANDDTQFLTGFINSKSSRSAYTSYYLPYDRFLIVHIESFTYYHYKDQKNIDQYRCNSHTREKYMAAPQ